VPGRNSIHPLPLFVSVLLYLYETEHTIIDKMVKDPTDHEVGTRFRKMHCFSPVSLVVVGNRIWIKSPVNSVIGIVDDPSGCGYTLDKRSRIDLPRLGSVIVNDDQVQTGNYEVYRITFRDSNLVGDQLVIVPHAPGGVGKEPIQWSNWWSLIGIPLAKADGGIVAAAIIRRRQGSH
jgi:hypothetical protein